ncbi:MAG: hypothetical protein HeimC2_25780, partial [Candidatus Heimdallarchaeota archaeon LC_2]
MQSSFIWEYEMINLKKRIIQKGQDLDEEEKIQLAKELSLTSKFLLRIETDLGLNFHIAQKL